MYSTNSITSMDLNEQITVSMASIPERESGMLRTVRTFLPYCDNFDVCLNGYPHADYDELKEPAVNVVRPDRDLGAAGKFYMTHRTPGYHIIVDDDLVYPEDYVMTILRGLNKYKRKAVVGFQGHFITHGIGSLISMYHQNALSQDLPVHMLGTATIAYHTDGFNIDYRNLLPGKVDDQIAGMAMEAGVPMICLEHAANWLVEDTKIALIRPLRRNMAYLEAACKRMANRTWTFKPMPE